MPSVRDVSNRVEAWVMAEPEMVHVAVVGGGIAGLACAVQLANTGIRVTVLERSNRLGGRAGSFHDPSVDEHIDNCQHVALGCCTQYLDLLRQLGVGHALEWTSTFSYVEPDGRISTLPIPKLPRPFHGIPLLTRARFLTIRDRFAIARAFAGLLLGASHAWSGRSFSEWLGARHQPASAIRDFWTPIVVSACNARPNRCDAAAAIKVFREGFLRSQVDARMGVPCVPLSELYAGVPAVLESTAGSVRLGAHVTAIEPGAVLLRTGERVEADAIVLATPFTAAAGLLDASPLEADGVTAHLRQLSHSPIVAVHAAFAEPVTDLPHAVLLDADFDWLFFKDAGRRVHAVASAADELTDRSADDLVTSLTVAIQRRFGVTAQPTWARAIKERRATFLVEPGSDAHRPATDALAPHVWLAGDYTATGWPATMEGATRSGRLAAEQIAAHFTA